MKHYYKCSTRLTNATEPAAPTSVWGYRGCAGKGGHTTNFSNNAPDRENRQNIRR